MAKRRSLSFDNQALEKNLQESAARGIDAFFSAGPVNPPSSVPEAKSDPEIERNIRRSPNERANTQDVENNDDKPTIDHDVMEASNHESMKERKQSSNHDVIIESIRKSVKEIGKEQTTHRTTLEEKRVVMDIVFAYSHLGIRTSENEVARIAISFLVNDYKANGENSILHKVLKALNE